MFSWLYKLYRRFADDNSNGSVRGNAANYTTTESLIKEMHEKGFQGPFGDTIDGIKVIIFRTSGDISKQNWLEEDNNLFRIHTLDCSSICQQSLLYAYGKRADTIQHTITNAPHVNEEELKTKVSNKLSSSQCAFGYPRYSDDNLSDGILLHANCMEGLWNIYFFNNKLYFTRSWTGELRYIANVFFTDFGMFIDNVETYSVEFPNHEIFGPRQVDFLIKATLYKVQSPAPIPQNIKSDESEIAGFALSEYGNLASYASFEDTTQHRLCLNGVLKSFPSSTNHETFLLALIAIQHQKDPWTRKQLLNALAKHEVYMSLKRLDEQAEMEPVMDSTGVSLVSRIFNNRVSVFAYSDWSYCIEKPGVDICLSGSSLVSFIRQWQDEADLVINPGGPYTVALTMSELDSIAGETKKS